MKKEKAIHPIIPATILLTAGIISPSNSIGSILSTSPIITICIVVVATSFCLGVALITKPIN